MAFTLVKLYQGTPLAVPSPPVMATILANSGISGTIANGTRISYRISAIVGGVETLAGAAQAVTLAASGGPWAGRPVWNAVPGASSYRVYGRTSGSELLIATVSGGPGGTPGSTSYLDLGTITPSGALPSSTTLVEAAATPGLYRPPTGKGAVVRDITVSNASTYTGALYLSVVSSGGTGGSANRIISGVPIPPDAAGGPVQISGYWPLSAGDFLTGYVTVPSAVLTISGAEIS